MARQSREKFRAAKLDKNANQPLPLEERLQL
jgi:hypothetical protein